MAKLQIGQIGCGHWGRYVLRDLLLLGTDVHLVEKSTESKERLRNEGYSVCDTLNDLPEVDAYVIVSPTSTHAELISQIIDQNKPIFCEKPLCNSYEDAQKLNTHNNKDIFIMDKWHYHAGIIELGKIVKSGELGKVIGWHC
jgi:predicted dehydrogenase